MSKQLTCSRCRKGFNIDDVLSYDFFVQNLMCFDCCERLMQFAPSVSCFGKQYDPDAVECKRFCPDRVVCPMFQNGKVYEARDLTEEARKKALRFLRTPRKLPAVKSSLPFRRDSIIGKGFLLCMKGCTREELQALCDKEGADIKRLLRLYKHEIYKGHQWEWIERGSDLRIVYPRQHTP